MASSNVDAGASHASMPFWDFFQSLDPATRTTAPGEGIDFRGDPQPTFSPRDLAGWVAWGPHAAATWGPWGSWGFGGRRGRGFHPWEGRNFNPNQAWDEEGRQERGPGQPGAADNERQSADTVRDGPNVPHSPSPPPPPHPGSPHHRHGPSRPLRCGFGRGRGRGRRGYGGDGGHPCGLPSPYPGAFNLPPWLENLQNHPLAQSMRQHLEQYAHHTHGGDRDGQVGNDVDFAPPVDVFDRPTEWQVHVALPGAKKDDIGVNWDADKKTLNVAGVVHRPGDEEFLQSLTSTCERRLGMFDRSVKLPATDGDENDEADGDGITAKFEEGLLIVTVPKVERDWTEIRKVDVK